MIFFAPVSLSLLWPYLTLVAVLLAFPVFVWARFDIRLARRVRRWRRGYGGFPYR